MKIGPLEIDSRRLGIFIVIGLVLFMVMNFSARLGDLAHLQNIAKTARVQATGVIITQGALHTQVAQATSPDAVGGYARGEARMGKPGDKVVIVLPVPGATPEPTPTPSPVVNELTQWEIWKFFLFGK